MMTTIYFIRHAEAEGNLYRRLHGQHDTLLTPTGVRQAEALRRRFAGVRLHACYASDLNRAVQTALPVCKDHRLRLRREPAFREVCFGTWEDQSFGTLEHLYPEQMRVFRQNMWAWQAPGSETLEQATGRFIEALRAVAERHAGQTVAIFTHGAILRAVQAELFFTRQTMNRAGRCDNTGVSRVQYEGGRFTLDYLNASLLRFILPDRLASAGIFHRDHLRQNADRQLLWPLAAQIQADGRMQPGKLLGRDALAQQERRNRRNLLSAPQHTGIGKRLLQNAPHGIQIRLMGERRSNIKCVRWGIKPLQCRLVARDGDEPVRQSNGFRDLLRRARVQQPPPEARQLCILQQAPADIAAAA